jgi:hypothetical protein
MTTSIPACPHCGAPLATSRFAATAVCGFCAATVRVDTSVVSAERYREAWRAWSEPDAGDRGQFLSIGDDHWGVERPLAHGEICDVFLARRARWPTELALVKVLRSADDAPLLDREWRALATLHGCPAAEGLDFAVRVPFPIVAGTVSGSGEESRAAVYRWAPGFVHTAEAVHLAYPEGISPASSIWVWRRILEILSVMERAGLAHGAVLPNHLLIEDGEHGVRLVGFSCAAAPSSPLPIVCTQFENFYPGALLDGGKLTRSADLAMSARCVAYLLGGSGRDGEVPDHVPAPLADMLRNVGADSDHSAENAWALRERLGDIAKSLFGPPAFHPISMD